jgi:putative DNA primase/helicase
MAAEHGWETPSSSSPEHAAKKPVATPPKSISRANPIELWNRCEAATEAHSYIEAKQGIPDGLRVVPAGDGLRIAGESMAGALVVPVVRADGVLSTVQLIASSETGARLKAKGKPAKLNLPGGRLEGWFTVGALLAGGIVYVCEGLGQAWACWKATGDAAVVCFGWGRVRAVAAELRQRDPSAQLVLVPDSAKENDAADIARDCGASVAAMPAGWPVNADVNDLALRDGYAALEVLLTQASKPPEQDPRFKLLTGNQLRDLPPLAWRVRGVLPAVGLAALYGPSMSGKSFLALDLACAIAEGCCWFGRRVDAAPVVYVALEGQAGFTLRVQAWKEHKSRALPSALRLMLEAFKLTEPRDVEDLAAVVPAGAVVFLDTLSRAAPGVDENSSRDMGEILAAAMRLQLLTGGLVVLVHHTGKDLAKGLRGHSSLLAAMDAAVEVSREGERRKWRVAKCKDGRDGDAHPFRLQVRTLGADEDGVAITSCVVEPEGGLQEVRRVKLPQGDNQRLVLDALRPLFTSGETGKPGAPPLRPCIELDVAIAKCAEQLTCATSRRVSRAKEAVAGLIERGVLGCGNGWLWMVG